MDAHRAGAYALIAGAILAALVFAFHPSHAMMEPILGPFTLSQLVHGTALVAIPLLVFGMWQMAEWLGPQDTPVRLGFLLAALAMILTANAAVVSNFVTPAAARATLAGHSPRAAHAPAQASAHGQQTARPPMPPLIQTSVAMNRGFAHVHVAYLSLGLIFLGWAIRRRRRALLGWAGMALGAYPILWQLSGQFSPETTTMPWIVFPQSAWMIAVAVAMLRNAAQEERPHGSH